MLGGLQKTTLIDYPGKIACTVFTVGCNFRCPFCHNKDLLSLELFKKSGIKQIRKKDFFDFLKKRKKILEGVCITGGEPTIWPDLPEFIKKIKSLDYAVKLDTNGSRPEVLEGLIKKELIDYVAMDIKGPLSKEYLKIVGLRSDRKLATLRTLNLSNTEDTENSRFLSGNSVLQCCEKSIRIILKSGLDYEFRTTVVPGLHNKESLLRLARQLSSLATSYQLPATSFKWVLQQFRPKNCLDPEFSKVEPYSEKKIKDILKSLQEILPGTKLRGVE